MSLIHWKPSCNLGYKSTFVTFHDEILDPLEKSSEKGISGSRFSPSLYIILLKMRCFHLLLAQKKETVK